MKVNEIAEYLEKKRPDTVMGLVGKDGELLAEVIAKNNIKTIVETGICFGFSSAFFLAALPADGTLVSVEPFMKPRKDILVPKEFDAKWLPIQNYSKNVLETILKTFLPVDMFFHDSDHKYEPMMFEYRLAAKYKVKFVASDDIGAGNAGAVWNDFLKEHNYKEIARGRRCAIAQKQ